MLLWPDQQTNRQKKRIQQMLINQTNKRKMYRIGDLKTEESSEKESIKVVECRWNKRQNVKFSRL